MSNNNINSVLQRKLSSGLAYAKTIEKTSCTITPLPEGDTFHSIDMIKQYALKYQHQTQRWAKQLVKKSLPETVNSFFRFCYDHFQYKADGAMQNIKSPACAWHSRKEGMDCKSFSVLASTLCSNAGLKHYIRKIKQPFFHPEQFTHVYVIIPNDQEKGSLKNGYYIIDGTTHNNEEALFTDKNDTFMDAMPHQGLNAPRTRIHPIGSSVAKKAINSCGRLKPGFTFNKGGKTITQHGLNGAVNYDVAMKEFCKFLNLLREANVHPSVIAALKKRVKEYVAAGIDPEWQFVEEGVLLQGEFYRYAQPGYPLRVPETLKRTMDNGLNGLNSGDETSIINQAIGAITGGGWFASTFGAIFANGFDLSCVNSGYTPQKAQQHVPLDIPFIAKWAGIYGPGATVNTATYSQFLRLIKAYIQDGVNGARNTNLAKCSRDGHKARYLAAMKAEESIMNALKAKGYQFTFNKVPTIGSVRVVGGLPGYARGRDFKMGKEYGDTHSYFYHTYDIVNTQTHTGGIDPPVVDGGGGSTTTPIFTPITRPGTGTTPPTGDSFTDISKSTPKQASINWLLVAVLAGGAIYGAKKYAKNNPKNTSK